MASEEALPQGRPSIRTPRAFQDVHPSEQRSFFGSKKSRQKLATDKLVWFSPVHSPLLSPAREKTLQSVKKKVRQSSIFSIQNRGKGSIEAEEPTSPKVSCIGQVRAHKKDKDPFADAIRKKSSQSKPGSMSPARFFASPGRASKWGSLFGSRKESCATTQSSSGYGEGEVSCFGLPFETRSAFQTDKTCAFLARSLDLYQECRSSDNSHTDRVMHSSTNASDYQFEKQGICAAADGYNGIHTSDQVDSHASACTGFSQNPQKKGACEMSGSAMAVERGNCQHASLENPSHENGHHGKHPAVKQRLTYEELPSLDCGASSKQNMKISVEVVPETWLWRNGERLRPDSISHLSCIPDRSASTSREDLQKTQQDELNMPVSPCGGTQSYSRDAETCIDHQILLGQSHLAGSESADQYARTNDSFVEAGPIPVDNSTCQPLDWKDEKKDDAQHTLMIEPSESHVVISPSCTQIAAVQEVNAESRSSAGIQGGTNEVQRSSGFQGGADGVESSATSQSGANGAQIGKQQVHFEKLKIEADVEKSHSMLGSFEINPGHQTIRIGVDVGKENYGIAFPHLLEKTLPSLHPKEDGNQFWSILKGRKNEALPAQPFSTLILVGYDRSSASKDMGCKDEELLKGILEIGRLSFCGSGKYFQVLNSDAAFNRSRSVTSHRTVIRLQRSNSDPCRSSC